MCVSILNLTLCYRGTKNLLLSHSFWGQITARVKRLIGRPLESTLAERKSTTSYGEELFLLNKIKNGNYAKFLFDLRKEETS